MIGIVPFSFGLRDDELNDPCLSNIDLAVETKRISSRFPDAHIVAQWEVANVLRRLYGIEPHCTVWEHRDEGAYLDSDEVMAQAADYFHAHGIKDVIPVAHPFLHRSKCIKLVKTSGFSYLAGAMRTPIRFDGLSAQPWTRSKWGILKYGVKQKLFGHKGNK